MNAEHKTDEQTVPLEGGVVAVPEVLAPAVAVEVKPEQKAFPRRGERAFRGGGGGRGRGPRAGRDERRSEFAQKLIGIRRVARVMAGGGRFYFSSAPLRRREKEGGGGGVGGSAR